MLGDINSSRSKKVQSRPVHGQRQVLTSVLSADALFLQDFLQENIQQREDEREQRNGEWELMQRMMSWQERQEASERRFIIFLSHDGSQN